MDPKVAVITGCSSGIGLATASILAKDGEKRFRVYATMRNLDKKGSLESACQDALGDTLFIRELDVSSDDSVEEALNAIYEEEGRIDILVNNAGISHIGMLETQTQSLVKETFNTNFFGVLRMSKAVIPRMKSDHSGHIINISSTAGHTGMPFTGLYCASKFAVEGLSESLAPLLRKFGVKISIIEPGPVNSPSASFNQIAVPEEEDADEETKELLENFRCKIKGASNIAQSADEIADVILDVILAEKPHLRYQTNKNYANTLSRKLVDPSGDKAVDVMFTRFFV